MRKKNEHFSKIRDEFKASIKLKFQELQTKEDLVELLNETKRFLINDNCTPIKLKTLNYYANPKFCKKRYTQFTIPKKSGNKRTINAPVKGLKSILKVLNFVLQCVFEPHENAVGFVPGKSILDGAKAHTNKKYVYNIDLSDFFHSFDIYKVKRGFKEAPFNLNSKEQEPLAFFIASLCTHPFKIDNKEKIVLPQGSPTSPTITNILCSRLDKYLSSEAKSDNISYTRYADDISFSCNTNKFKRTKFKQMLQRILWYEGLTLQHTKTRLLVNRGRRRQEVTGLVVNDKVNINRRYIKEIRMLLYYWERYGYKKAKTIFLENYSKDSGNNTKPDFINSLKGKIDFVNMIGFEQHRLDLRKSKYNKLRDRFDRLLKKHNDPKNSNSKSIITKGLPTEWFNQPSLKSIEHALFLMENIQFKDKVSIEIARYQLDEWRDAKKYKYINDKKLLLDEILDIFEKKLAQNISVDVEQIKTVKASVNISEDRKIEFSALLSSFEAEEITLNVFLKEIKKYQDLISHRDFKKYITDVVNEGNKKQFEELIKGRATTPVDEFVSQLKSFVREYPEYNNIAQEIIQEENKKTVQFKKSLDKGFDALREMRRGTITRSFLTNEQYNTLIEGKEKYPDLKRHIEKVINGYTHDPKRVVKLLSQFKNNNNALKFTTHLWDGQQEMFNRFQTFSKKIYERHKDLKTLAYLSPNLWWEKIFPFVFQFKLNKNQEEYKWGTHELRIGWMYPDDLKQWCKKNVNNKGDKALQPFSMRLSEYVRPKSKIDDTTVETFWDVVQLFKREIEFKELDFFSSVKFLIRKLLKNYNIDRSNLSSLKKFECMTNTEYILKAIEIIIGSITINEPTKDINTKTKIGFERSMNEEEHTQTFHIYVDREGKFRKWIIDHKKLQILLFGLCDLTIIEDRKSSKNSKEQIVSDVLKHKQRASIKQSLTVKTKIDSFQNEEFRRVEFKLKFYK